MHPCVCACAHTRARARASRPGQTQPTVALCALLGRRHSSPAHDHVRSAIVHQLAQDERSTADPADDALARVAAGRNHDLDFLRDVGSLDHSSGTVPAPVRPFRIESIMRSWSG